MPNTPLIERSSKMADTDKTNGKGKGHRAPLITFACAAALSLVYCFYVGVFNITDAGQIMGLLSNAFTVPGVFFLGFGALSFVKRRGGFDGISYCTRYMFNWLLPQMWLSRDEMTGKRVIGYRDYCESMRERERKKPGHTKCFLVVGAFFLFLGIVFAVIMNICFPGTSLAGF